MTDDVEPYVVKEGDHLDRIVFCRGVSAAEVWDHQANHSLRERRATPTQLHPGDIVYLPRVPRKGLSISARTSNRYRATIPTTPVALFFQKDGRSPLASTNAQIRGLPGTTEESPLEMMTTADGELHLEVPIIVRELEVAFPALNTVYQVVVGDLDPHDEISGATKRLRNLGYLSRDTEPSDEDAVAGAIRAFQRAEGVEATGQLDDATRERLQSAHRS